MASEVLYEKGEPLPVTVGVITAGAVHVECVESILSCALTHAVRQLFFYRSGPYLDDARNEVVRAFKAEEFRECTHLLMVDSDIEFTPDDVRALYAADKPVVTGIYHNVFSGVLRPIIYEWAQVDDGAKTLIPISAWYDGWPVGGAAQHENTAPLMEVDGCGGGFLLIRRDVLDALESIHGDPLPWFDEPVIGGVHFGEDLAFCIRARDAGFGVWAHRGVQVAHHKQTKLGGRQ